MRNFCCIVGFIKQWCYLFFDIVIVDSHLISYNKPTPGSFFLNSNGDFAPNSSEKNKRNKEMK